MTTDKAKFYLEVCKPKTFVTDCAKQYEEAFNMALRALDDVKKYKKAIEEIKADIRHELEHASIDEYGLDFALQIIERHLKVISHDSRRTERKVERRA